MRRAGSAGACGQVERVGRSQAESTRGLINRAPEGVLGTHNQPVVLPLPPYPQKSPRKRNNC
eukprot:3088905-Amphidinium_carterae.1